VQTQYNKNNRYSFFAQLLAW